MHVLYYDDDLNTMGHVLQLEIVHNLLYVRRTATRRDRLYLHYYEVLSITAFDRRGNNIGGHDNHFI